MMSSQAVGELIRKKFSEMLPVTLSHDVIERSRKYVPGIKEVFVKVAQREKKKRYMTAILMVPSESRPETMHRVFLGTSGAHCDCMGYARSRHGLCVHIIAGLMYLAERTSDGFNLVAPLIRDLAKSNIKPPIELERVPLSTPGLNKLFGGGLPRGVMTYLVGPYGSGKTTLWMQFMVEQVAKEPDNKNMVFILLQTENIVFDRLKVMAEARGVDWKNVQSKIIIYEARTLNEMARTSERILEDFTYAKDAGIDIRGIFLDSVTMLYKQELQKSASKQSIARDSFLFQGPMGSSVALLSQLADTYNSVYIGTGFMKSQIQIVKNIFTLGEEELKSKMLRGEISAEDFVSAAFTIGGGTLQHFVKNAYWFGKISKAVEYTLAARVKTADLPENVGYMIFKRSPAGFEDVSHDFIEQEKLSSFIRKLLAQRMSAQREEEAQKKAGTPVKRGRRRRR